MATQTRHHGDGVSLGPLQSGYTPDILLGDDLVPTVHQRQHPLRSQPIHLLRMRIPGDLDNYWRRRAHHLLLCDWRPLGGCGYGFPAGLDLNAVLPGSCDHISGQGWGCRRTGALASSSDEDIAFLRRIRLGLFALMDDHGFVA